MAMRWANLFLSTTYPHWSCPCSNLFLFTFGGSSLPCRHLRTRTEALVLLSLPEFLHVSVLMYPASPFRSRRPAYSSNCHHSSSPILIIAMTIWPFSIHTLRLVFDPLIWLSYRCSLSLTPHKSGNYYLDADLLVYPGFFNCTIGFAPDPTSLP